MKEGCVRWAGYGCVSGMVILILFIAFIAIYTNSPEKTLYYIDDVDMYILFDRHNGGTEGCVYFGKTLEDIDNKLDGFQVNRTDWDTHSIAFIRDCATDSIFVIASEEKEDTVISSTHYVTSLLRPIVKEVTCHGLDGEDTTSRVGFGHDTKRFRANPKRYLTFLYNWDAYWHEDNPLMIIYGHVHDKIDQSKVKYIDPIER